MKAFFFWFLLITAATTTPLQSPQLNIIQQLVWKDVNLYDSSPFNVDLFYRSYVGGWIYPVDMTSTGLFFIPSTQGKYYGYINYAHKFEWEYRIQGDSNNRPPSYPGYIGPVDKIQYLAIGNKPQPCSNLSINF